jgi:hypothetical protein
METSPFWGFNPTDEFKKDLLKLPHADRHKIDTKVRELRIRPYPSRPDWKEYNSSIRYPTRVLPREETFSDIGYELGYEINHEAQVLTFTSCTRIDTSDHEQTE